MINASSYQALGVSNPAEKLAPSAARLYLFADRLAREGQAEIAAQVRHAAGELEARPDAIRPDAARPGETQ